MVLDFSITSDYNILFINDHKFFLSHGHIYGPNNLPKLNKEDYFLSGHTHIPTIENHLLNPGSIALAKNDHPNTYAIIDEENFTVYTTKHEIYMQTKID